MRRNKSLLSLFILLSLNLFVLSMLILAFNIQQVKAQKLIVIRADGSVDPSTAPISTVDNITYTLTDNIDVPLGWWGIGVYRDNIVVDGAGYAIQQSTSQKLGGGINLDGRSNVTIKNVEINDLDPYDMAGIRLVSSSNNIISGSKITGNYNGIKLVDSTNNTISGNIITGSFHGIRLSGGSFNIFFGNNITGNHGDGVYLSGSSNNRIYHNNFIDNIRQVTFFESGYVNFWDDGYPSGGNYWSDHMDLDFYSGPYQNETGTDGIVDIPYIIDENNQDRYPIYRAHPPVARFTYSPTNSSVGEKITFNASSSSDLNENIISYLWDFKDGNISSTADSTIAHTYEFPGRFNVTLTVIDNDGLNSSCSHIVLVMMPTFVSISTSSSSTFVGLRVDITGTLRDVYGNVLKNETVVLYYTFMGISTWTPITSDTTDDLGNYHAVWIPPATGYFVIKAEWAGNTTHFATNNTVTLNSLTYNNQYVFSVESNSTVSSLAFNTTNRTLSFTVSGPPGTKGYVEVTVAKSLVADITDVEVYLDGDQLNYTITSIDDSWLLHFTYRHSTRTITISLGPAPSIPPQPITPLSLGILAVALAVVTILLIFKIRKGTPPTRGEVKGK